MDPSIKERFNKMKLQNKQAIEDADKAISSMTNTVEESKQHRMKLLFSHLCETSGYLSTLNQAVTDLLKKRDDTIPAMKHIANQFEKRKTDKKIVETVANSASAVAGVLALTGVGAPLAAGLIACSIGLSLGAEIAVHCLGSEELEKFTNIIGDDNCTSDLITRVFGYMATEIIFFEENGIIASVAFYLIKLLKIKKN